MCPFVFLHSLKELWIPWEAFLSIPVRRSQLLLCSLSAGHGVSWKRCESIPPVLGKVVCGAVWGGLWTSAHVPEGVQWQTGALQELPVFSATPCAGGSVKCLSFLLHTVVVNEEWCYPTAPKMANSHVFTIARCEQWQGGWLDGLPRGRAAPLAEDDWQPRSCSGGGVDAEIQHGETQTLKDFDCWEVPQLLLASGVSRLLSLSPFEPEKGCTLCLGHYGSEWDFNAFCTFMHTFLTQASCVNCFSWSQWELDLAQRSEWLCLSPLVAVCSWWAFCPRAAQTEQTLLLVI